MSAFENNLSRGKLAESKIARYLRSRGWTIIPVYEIEAGSGKGPQVYTPFDEIVAPDLLVWKQNRFRFIEAKNKSVFTRYRKKNRFGYYGRWQTGIDQRHYEHYLRVGEHFGLDIWLMFLHEQGTPSDIDLAFPDCPRECPTGLFGNALNILSECVDHPSSRWAKGMVYWNKESLRLICPVSELNKPTESFAFERAALSGEQRPLFLGGENG